jgi:hypothetical protein
LGLLLLLLLKLFLLLLFLLVIGAIRSSAGAMNMAINVVVCRWSGAIVGTAALLLLLRVDGAPVSRSGGRLQQAG